MPITLILDLIKINWKPLFITTVAVLLLIGAYNQGKRNVQDKWDKTTALAIIDAREIEQENAVITNKIGTDYEKRKADIDAGFNAAIDGLLATSGDLPAKTNSACKFDATTNTGAVHKANARKLIALAKEAEINTAKLIALQAWEKMQKVQPLFPLP